MISKKEGIVFDFMKGKVDNNINLVFVHGSGCNKTFLQSMREFVSEYNCYFIDLPGHGDSDNTGYNTENYINAISNFVSDLDNVILLGHSLGGTLVLGATARNIPSVKGSVIISSGASFPKLDKEFMNKIHSEIIDMDSLLYCFGHMDDPAVQEAVNKMGPKEVLIKDFIIDEYINVEKCLKDIKVPITIVTGGDEILTLIEYSELIHNKVANSKLVIIPKTKHMLPVVRREEVAKLIKELVNSIVKK